MRDAMEVVIPVRTMKPLFRWAGLGAGLILTLALANAQNLRLVNPPPLSGTSDAFFASISSDARYVAFVSSGNLTSGEPAESFSDIYVRDMTTGDVTRVSVGHAGATVDGSSDAPDVSADGRYVAFVSSATNLVVGDTNGVTDVFVRDTLLNTTTLASVRTPFALADGPSSGPSLSADGQSVAFLSSATNLVPSDTNGVPDVFIRSIATASTYRASVGTLGQQANNASSVPKLSGDGRIVAFFSAATNLDPAVAAASVYVHDVDWRRTLAVGADSAGFWPATPLQILAGAIAISPDGGTVAFGVNYAGLGRSVVIRDLRTGAVEIATLTSLAGARSGDPFGLALSDGGRYVVMQLGASVLTPSDPGLGNQAYLRDRWTGTTRRVNVTQSGGPSGGGVGSVDLSYDGRTVAFTTSAQDHGVTPLYPSSAFLSSGVRTVGSDLALVESVNQRSLIGQMNGHNVLHWEWATDRPSWPFAMMAVGDVHGDGFADVIIQSPITRQLRVGTMNGATVQSWAIVSQVPNQGWNFVAAADFQGTGRVGLLFQHQSTLRMAIAILNGPTILGWQNVSQWPNVNWVVRAAGDVNADGLADILFQHNVSNRVTAGILNGSGVVTAWRDFSQVPGSGWVLRAVGEFDGDLQRDLVFQHQISGQITIALCTGMTVDAWRTLNDNPTRRFTVIGAGAF